MTDKEYKEMCEIMDGCYEAMESRQNEIDACNDKLIEEFKLTDHQVEQLFSDDLLGCVTVTSKIEKCDPPFGMSPEQYRYIAVDFLPIYVRQTCGYLGDDYSGTVWFTFKGETYKFNYEC